jgi:hypothetical protein
MMERVLLRTHRDDELFKKWTRDLPVRLETTPFHSGAHSIRQMRGALHLVGRGDGFFNVLETGFCLGHSARIFLGLGVDTVTSIENSQRLQTKEAAAIVKATHKDAFEFISGDAIRDPEPLYLHLKGRRFDLMFIDGNHNIDGVQADLALGLKLKITHFLFDDFYPHWGPGVLPTIEHGGLIPLASLGTMMLCTTPELYF